MDLDLQCCQMACSGSHPFFPQHPEQTKGGTEREWIKNEQQDEGTRRKKAHGRKWNERKNKDQGEWKKTESEAESKRTNEARRNT